MTGNLRPKSMSVKESEDYLADARNWVAEPLPYDLREQDGPESESASVQPVGDTEVGEQVVCRPMEELEADINVVCGPAALTYTVTERHLATLRLIDDLLFARDLLESYETAAEEEYRWRLSNETGEDHL